MSIQFLPRIVTARDLNKPTLQEVLQFIGKRGVIVGSVAKGNLEPKDLDIVVKSRGLEDRDNSIFQHFTSTIDKKYFDSECIGHLVVYTQEIPVEMFEHDGFECLDKSKNAGRTTFSKARRKAVKKKIQGIEFYFLEE